LIDRKNVDFPQPDGPMSAITLRGSAATVISNNACFSPYQNEKLSAETRPRAPVASVHRRRVGGNCRHPNRPVM
jgi:hypothetical protein